MHCMRLGSLIAACVLTAVSAAHGQYIFTDTNGDGVATSEDRLRASGPTSIDIWLQTDAYRDGSPVSVLPDENPLSIFAYTFILGAEGGSVAWGKYTNARTEWATDFGRLESETEIHLGYGGMEALPPGKYKLGTLMAQVKSGSPSLRFLSTSSLDGGLATSFGSHHKGREGHTIVLGDDPAPAEGALPGLGGDWSDSDGLGAPEGKPAGVSGLAPRATLRFSVEVAPNPSGPEALRLRVVTTRPGRLRAQLYDTHGRLVQSLGGKDAAPAGVHVINLLSRHGGSTRLASGVYHYRVESVDGVRTGRVTLVR